MRASLRTYLGFSYLAVVLLGMGVAALLTGLAVERLYIQTQTENLLAQAKLIASALRSQSSPSGASTPYSQASNFAPGIHTRLIDPQGAAIIDVPAIEPAGIADNLVLPSMAQNAIGQVSSQELFARPEIVSALQGQASTAIRRIDTPGGRPVLYAAAPVISNTDEVLQIVYLATPLPNTQWYALSPGTRIQFIAILLIAILLAGGSGIFISGRLAYPIGQLANAAQSVSTGNWNYTNPSGSSIRELAVLNQAFARMVGSLKQSDQVKTNFIAAVSHELRTPLTVIKGTVETLQDGAIDDLEARGPFLDSMNKETERLIRLVNDLLILTRADAGELNLRLEKIDLEDLANARCRGMQRIADLRQVRLVVSSEYMSGTGGVCVQADPDRMAQIFDNLLDNAIRYSPEGGRVEVKLARENEQIVCQVMDVGPGISAQHLPHIFDRFYRADAARDRMNGGSGLGLAIVRELVESHGGQVEASSIEGKGTTLTIRLPAVQE